MTATYPARWLPSRLTAPAAAAWHPALPRRTAQAYLMCPPDHFTVQYAINPWMASGEPVDTARAMRQWQRLRDTYRALGHTVQFIDRQPGPAGHGLRGQRRHRDRRHRAGRPVPLSGARRRRARPTWTGSGAAATARCTSRSRVNEGEGDIVHAGRVILAGHGFRTDAGVRHELEAAVRAAGDQPAPGGPAVLPPGHGAVRARRRHRRLLPGRVRRRRAGRARRAASPS